MLAAAGTLSGTAIAGAVSGSSGTNERVAAARRPGKGGEPSRSTGQLLADTVHETPLYEIDAPQDGPTAMVFGGVHGDEYNGIEVAHEVANWYPDAGTLVVIPETNRVAVENNARNGINGDLNRHFPADGKPVSKLARGIWDAVERYNPDVVLDLHRSLGIYGVHRAYVGQAVLHSPNARGEELAAVLNDDAVPWYLPFHHVTAIESSLDYSLLFHKVGRELGSAAYLFETTNFLLDRETKNEMTRIATAATLELHGLLEPKGNQ